MRAFLVENDATATILNGIEERIAAAEHRYGEFASTHEAMGVACEEWDEFRDAVRSNDLAAVEHECMDLAAVLIRLARNLHGSKTIKRSTK